MAVNARKQFSQFSHALVSGSIYSLIFPCRLDAPRCRTLLTELEAILRTPKSEEPQIPDLSKDLDIDHIMPQSWYEHWPLPDGSKATTNEASAAVVQEMSGNPLDDHQATIRKRMKAIPTLGNLTLLNLSANREAKHKAFLEKKKLLITHTNLSLNVKLINQDVWNEDTIAERSKMLAEAATKLYPS